jgi:hypothetical protein
MCKFSVNTHRRNVAEGRLSTHFRSFTNVALCARRTRLLASQL